MAQTYFNLSYGQGSETWSGIDYENLWHADIYLQSRLNGKIRISLAAGRNLGSVQWARIKGRETTIKAPMDLKPFDRLVIEPSINYAISKKENLNENIYEQFISRTRIRLQATKKLSLRLVIQYNISKTFLNNIFGDQYENRERKRWDIDPLLTYQISPFSKFYIGSTVDYRHFNTDTSDPSLYKEQWKMTSRQFFMKLQYLFQT